MKCFRFNLRTLLVVIGLLGLPFAYLSQAGFAEAQFEIQSNELEVDSLGVLRGDLVCLCSIPGTKTTKMICRIEQSHFTDLKLLKPEATYLVRYRWDPPFGLFPKQDAYGMFLTRKLGFDAQDVVGQMKMRFDAEGVDGQMKLGFDAEDVVGQMEMIDESVVLIRQKP